MTEHHYAGRVVVGYDGSHSSDDAVVWACEEARARGRGLVLLNALVPPVAAGGLGVGLPPTLEVIDGLEQNARAELDAAAARLVDGPGAGVDIECVVAVGSPSGVLLEASETASLIVVGSRGHGGFRGLLLGSVSGQVAAHSACPVAVIRGHAAAEAASVVVGIDGSDAAEAALSYAFATASMRGLGIVAVHAWDVPAYDLLIVPNGPVPIPLNDVADDEVRMTAEVLAGFRDEYPDVAVEERLVRNQAVKALLAASEHAAMVVVGTHGHGPTVGALLGSVSNGLLHKSKVPVVVVPPSDPGPSAA
jgi:nucleotide-binding universal stress UspA family protein